MASSTTSTPLSLSSSSAFINPKAPSPRSQVAAAAQCATLPTLLPAVHSNTHLAKINYYNGTFVVSPRVMLSGRKIARNVVAMATGEAPAEVVATTETPEFVKTIQEAWEKVDDKYAVSSLVVAGGVVLWASVGMISAIDRLPLVPGILELVGIGYTGWFAYRNLVAKTEREALFQKIKNTYCDIIGSS